VPGIGTNLFSEWHSGDLFEIDAQAGGYAGEGAVACMEAELPTSHLKAKTPVARTSAPTGLACKR
jgi:hypothetical protein